MPGAGSEEVNDGEIIKRCSEFSITCFILGEKGYASYGMTNFHIQIIETKRLPGLFDLLPFKLVVLFIRDGNRLSTGGIGN